MKVNDEIVEYLGYFYIKRQDTNIYDFIETLFIGRVIKSILTGIYIHPMYVYLNDEWRYITNEPNHSLYPHLLSNDSIPNAIPTLYSLKKAVIPVNGKPIEL